MWNSPIYNLAILSHLYHRRVVGGACLSGREKKEQGGEEEGEDVLWARGLVEHSNIFSKKWVLLCDPVQDAPPLILVHEH